MKSLLDVVPDFREALEQGLEEAAETVTDELKRAGPYWSGQFESLWVVNAGKKAIRASIPTVQPVPRGPIPPKYTPTDVPSSPNLGGYTIGNQAQYRLYAMDILPTPYGRQQGDAPNATADKFWFDTYRNSKMPRTINRVLTNVFRRYQ